MDNENLCFCGKMNYHLCHEDTEDIERDYLDMLPDFGESDPDVKFYKEELDRREKVKK